MTDRELLELAARAIGATVRGIAQAGFSLKDDVYIIGFFLNEVEGFWNPLTDDGDALRLAVKLQIDLLFINGDTHVLNASEGGPDKDANTRRAIVRAAAEIGRGMT